MKKYVVIVVTIIAIYVLATSLYPTYGRDYLLKEIKEANYCSVDSDCVRVSGDDMCIFGCGGPVINKAEVKHIQRVASFLNFFHLRSICAPSCILHMSGPSCVENRCALK